MIARQFAETGVKELMNYIYELLLKYQDKERVVMLRNEWVPVRPDSWSDKMDCTVSVALGNGSKDQQMAHLSQMIQFAAEAMRGGLPIVTPQNMYNLGSALVKAMGYQNVGDFLTPPPPPQPEQPKPEDQTAMMEQQIKMKELEIKQGDLQVKMMKVQQDAQEAAVDAQLKAAELALEEKQNRGVALG
jgi:outer membrane biosynthesis protein TonB